MVHLLFVQRKRAIFNGFLSVFSPSVTVFKMINFTLGNECKPLLANSFWPHFFNLTPGNHFKQLLLIVI
ncbi:hypothetical protein Hanom_Chr09g00813841 [Helianthus anomalus]